MRRKSIRIELYSPLPPVECVSRLSAAIDLGSWGFMSFATIFGSRPVMGIIIGSSLRLRKRIAYHNSFQNILTASIRSEGAGTLITGEFALQPLVQMFMAIWVGGLILLGTPIFFISIRDVLVASAPHHDNAWLGVVIAPLMLIFFFAIVRFGRYLARDEARFITDFLIQVLDANDRTASIE